MYVLSQVNLTLKKGVGDHADVVFINKATIGNGVENTHEGLTILGEAMLADKSIAKRTIKMIGRDAMNVTLVAKAMMEGAVAAYQYHKEGYAEPKWQIAMGFEIDVQDKNDEYSGKKPKAKQKAKAKTVKKVPLIS